MVPYLYPTQTEQDSQGAFQYPKTTSQTPGELTKGKDSNGIKAFDSHIDQNFD